MAKEKISYDEAVKEIESTLETIESGSLGVDELSDKVKRITMLLKVCRERLYKTEQEIGRIIEESEKGQDSEQEQEQ